MQKTPSRKLTAGLWIGISMVVFLFGIWYFTRSYVMAAYSVPTTSMEKTIRLGGKVLVNKLNYHPISREDILVFHFPAGDTVINLSEYQSMQPYYDVIRELGKGNVDSGRQIVLNDRDDYPLVFRPVSRRETYLKRCIGIPGDTLEMRDEQLFIDGRQEAWPSGVETDFLVVMGSQSLDEETIKAKYGLDISNPEEMHVLDSVGKYTMRISWKVAEQMLQDGFARRIVPAIDTATEGVFPNDNMHHWTRDNYGPLWIPKKGASLVLTPLNYPIYERIIRTYEGNTLEMKGGKIYINGQEANTYTFKMDYYWVIGDNLHGSQDSRYWGFVPEDHLIGKVWKLL